MGTGIRVMRANSTVGAETTKGTLLDSVAPPVTVVAALRAPKVFDRGHVWPKGKTSWDVVSKVH